jgi:hypothetical protein
MSVVRWKDERSERWRHQLYASLKPWSITKIVFTSMIEDYLKKYIKL